MSVLPLAAASLARALAGAPADTTLVVAEVFGPTIQGEGPSTGRRAAFIRLGGCNLHCTWCDTAYTWDADRHDLRVEMGRRRVEDIVGDVTAMRVPLIVVTGGEPLLHQTQVGWSTLLGVLSTRGYAVEVETNGTQVPAAGTVAAVTRFNVSPKLAHADDGRDPASRRLVPAALEAFADLARRDRAVFKFVARTPEDLPEVAALVAAYRIPPDAVWVMPEGTTPTQVLDGARQLVDGVLAAGWNMTTRLHTLLWGQERSR